MRILSMSSGVASPAFAVALSRTPPPELFDPPAMWLRGGSLLSQMAVLECNRFQRVFISHRKGVPFEILRNRWRASWDHSRFPSSAYSGRACKKPPCVRMSGVAQHFPAVALFDDLAGVHDCQTIRDLLAALRSWVIKRMLRPRSFAKFPKQIQDLVFDFFVQGCCRLIGDQQFRNLSTAWSIPTSSMSCIAFMRAAGASLFSCTCIASTICLPIVYVGSNDVIGS